MYYKLIFILILTIIMNSLFSQSNQTCPPDSLNKLNLSTQIRLESVLSPPSPRGTPTTFVKNDDFRMVYWVHGMNGFSGSWSRAAAASSVTGLNIPGYKARKIISLLPDYSNNQFSVATAQTDLYSQLTVDPTLINYDTKNSIAIGHSQGGIIVRAIARDKKMTSGAKFGGFATFGSVNRGAAALTEPYATKSYQFFNTAFIDLSAGFFAGYEVLSEELNDNFFIKLFVGNKILPKASDVKDFIINKLLYNEDSKQNGLIMDLINNEVKSGLAEELSIGSPTMNQLNSEEPSGVACVAFYGVKNTYTKSLTDGSKLMVAPFYSLIHYAVNNPNIDGYFNAYEDWRLAEKARSAQLDYLERANQHDELIHILNNSHCIPGYPNPWNCVVCDHDTYIALRSHPISKSWPQQTQVYACRRKDKLKLIAQSTMSKIGFKQGAAWFDKADKLWQVAIGAESETIVETGWCIRKIYRPDGESKILRYFPGNGISCGMGDTPEVPEGWEALGDWQKEMKKVIIVKENDGAVLAESAKDLPFMTTPAAFTDKDQRMFDSSHFQMRNDNNTKNKLNLLWEGLCGDFFKTGLAE